MTRLKDIPELARDASNINAVIAAMREAIQTFRGYRGDPLDTAITRREATEIGVLNEDGSVALGSGAVGPAGPAGPQGPPGDSATITPDTTPPPTSEGLTVTAGIGHLYIQCNLPVYTQGHGHDLTVVYGAKWPETDVSPPTFSSAVELMRFKGTLTAYPTDPLTRWCIWIKWRSNDGVLSTNPAGGTNGVQATTGLDPTAMIASFGTAWIDSAMIANLSAAQLTAGDGTIGSSLKSEGYIPGEAGWQLDSTGVLNAARLNIGNIYNDQFTFDNTGAKFFGALQVSASTEIPASINGTFGSLSGWYLSGTSTPATANANFDVTGGKLNINATGVSLTCAKFAVVAGDLYTFKLTVLGDLGSTYGFTAEVVFDTNPALSTPTVQTSSATAIGQATLDTFTRFSTDTVTPYDIDWVAQFQVPLNAKFCSIILST